MESCLLQMPRIGAQQIIGENVGKVCVSVYNCKARTTGTIDILCPRFGAEFVVGVWLHWDELRDSCFRDASAIEGHRKRSCPHIELIRVYGQSSVRVRFVPPVKSTVQQVFLESSVHDKVLTRGKIRLKGFVNFGQLLPGVLCSHDFLVSDKEAKIGKCNLRRENLLQADQMIPRIFCSDDLLFGD